MKKIYFLLVSLLLSVSAFSSQTTEGTEFWVTYMNNANFVDESNGLVLELIISSRNAAEIVVENPRTGWKVTSSVAANTVKKISVPCSEGYIYYPGEIGDKGIRVTSSSPISLYASNYYSASYDATIVLPITGIGDEYVVQTDESSGLKEFCVVATENNTQVTIVPHADTYDGHVNGVAYNITLDRGQTYMVMSGDVYNELSGSQVNANKAISVFAGHQCANVPDGVQACDHIVEQQVPISQLGKSFALTKSYGQSYDVVRITAIQDNTVVRLNGVVLVTLQSFESYSFILNDNSAFLETSNPAVCYLYLTGAEANPNQQGDPSSVLISPIEQRLQEVTFSTFQTELSRDHYINIVTTKLGAQYIELDNVNIANRFASLNGNSELYFAQIPISHGTHTLKTNSDGFIGRVYGFGWCESYSYSIGSSTLDLSGMIVIEGVISSDFDGSGRCYKKPITFSPQTNDEYDDIIWNFGDGNTSNQETVTHTYSAPGTYEISMIISNQDGRDTAYASFTLVDVLYDTISVVVCDGESFMVGNDSYTYSKSGSYDITIPSVDGCDSIVTVNLTVKPSHNISIYDTICDGRTYVWDGVQYTETGTYTKIYTNHYGCDSIVTLYLTISSPYNDEFSIFTCANEPYTWDGRTYTKTGVYTHKYSSVDGCDSVVTLNLTVGDVYDIEYYDTICANETYRWNTEKYTATGSYTQSFTTKLGCDSIVTLHLTVGELYDIEIYDTICAGETYKWNAEQYTQSGSYMQSFTTQHGCDSLVTLHLSVGDVYNVSLYDTICSGEIYNWDGKSYTNTGVYVRKYASVLGCDSIVTLNLLVGEVYDIQLYDTICQGETYVWNNVKYTKSGSYTQPFTSQHGCDSIVTVHLFIAPIVRETYVEAICQDQPYTFGKKILTQPGTYVDTTLSMYGCDSITTLTLRVHEPYLIDQYIEVCHDDTFNFRGQVVEKPGIYYDSLLTQHGCDSVYRLIFNKTPTYLFHSEDTMCVGSTYTYRGKLLTQPGTYYDSLTTVSGCDSIYRLVLHTHPTYLIYALQTEDVCGDASTYEMVVQYDGARPSHYNLLYSEKAKEQGFRDILLAPFVNDTLNLPIPHATPYVRPDYYDVTLQLINSTCPDVSSEHETDLLVRYPSWIIEQNWQDVVAVKNARYNGGYYFQGYDWHVNNVSTTQTDSYLYLPSLQVGDEVVLYATRMGEDYAVPTCPIVIEPQNVYEQEHPVPVYPTRLTRSNRNITIGYANTDSQYYVYDVLGRQLASGVCGASEKAVLELPDVSGSYFVMIIDSSEQKQVVHVMVE